MGRLGLFAPPAAGDSEKPSGFPENLTAKREKPRKTCWYGGCSWTCQEEEGVAGDGSGSAGPSEEESPEDPPVSQPPPDTRNIPLLGPAGSLSPANPKNVLRVGRLGLFASPAAGDSEKTSGTQRLAGYSSEHNIRTAALAVLIRARAFLGTVKMQPVPAGTRVHAASSWLFLRAQHVSVWK